MTTPINPTPIAAPLQPLPDAQDMNTWAVRMAEMHRWMREDAAPGMSSLGADSYTNALAAQEQALLAAASGSFRGAWSSLSGALAMPASVYHDDRFWALLVNLGDVTTSEPGVSLDWVESGALKRSDVLLRLGAGDALPSSNIGPIWHDGYAAIMIWRTISSYEGYCSINLAQLGHFDAEDPPPGWVASNADISGAAFAALRAATGVSSARDARGVAIRGVDGGRGLDAGRALGTYQADDIKTGYFDSRRSSDGSPLINGWGGSVSGVQYGAANIGTLTGSGTQATVVRLSLGAGASETRMKNLALKAFWKF